jgi:hypothetical protein
LAAAWFSGWSAFILAYTTPRALADGRFFDWYWSGTFTLGLVLLALMAMLVLRSRYSTESGWFECLFWLFCLLYGVTLVIGLLGRTGALVALIVFLPVIVLLASLTRRPLANGVLSIWAAPSVAFILLAIMSSFV